MFFLFTSLWTSPSSSATRITAAAFCVVATSGRPNPTMPLEPMPSAGSILASLRARFSLAKRALLTALARGFTSCACMFLRTSCASAIGALSQSSNLACSRTSMARAMAAARVMVFLLIWYLLVPRGVRLFRSPWRLLLYACGPTL